MRDTIRYSIYAGAPTTPGFSDGARAILMAGILDRARIAGATILRARGVFRGEVEASLKVELIAPHCGGDFEKRVLQAAELYRRAADQDEVWVTRESVQLEIIDGEDH